MSNKSSATASYPPENNQEDAWFPRHTWVVIIKSSGLFANALLIISLLIFVASLGSIPFSNKDSRLFLSTKNAQFVSSNYRYRQPKS